MNSIDAILQLIRVEKKLKEVTMKREDKFGSLAAKSRSQRVGMLMISALNI